MTATPTQKQFVDHRRGRKMLRAVVRILVAKEVTHA